MEYQNLIRLRKLLNCVEKISVNSSIFKNPNLIKEASQIVGSQSVAVTIDYKKDFLLEDTLNTYSMEKRKLVEVSPKQLNMSKIRAGEIIFNSIDHDGMMQGFDLDFLG